MYQYYRVKLGLACVGCVVIMSLGGCGSGGKAEEAYADKILNQDIIADINMSAYTGSILSDGNASDYNQVFITATDGGGNTTVSDITIYTSDVFAQPAPNLSLANLDFHLEGDVNFETSFIGSINSNTHLAGLGPVQNNNNCEACHPGDGRSNMPYVPHRNFDDTMFVDKSGFRKLRSAGVFLRISIENDAINKAPKTRANSWGAPVPVPNFSDQLFQVGTAGMRDAQDGFRAGQANVWIKYKTKTVIYPDGETVELSRPYLFADNPYDDPDDPKVFNPRAFSDNSKSELFKKDVKMGIRMGMPVFALGLIDAIKIEDILSQVDINDSDGDGISGKPNWVFDKEKFDYCNNPINNFSCEDNPPISLGRYGWKANTPTVAHQGLGASRGDMGVTNPLFRMESIAKTDLMKNFKNKYPDFKTFCDDNLTTDADMDFSQSTIFYLETLAVPKRVVGVNEADTIKGGALFNAIGCVKCHTPEYTTGMKSGSFSVKYDRNPYDPNKSEGRILEVENQKIYPYTDMLLHDMGPDLADGRKDFDAHGNEWKTRPLWGIGRTHRANPAAGFLHDGRARTIEEAIIWHGGESEAIKVHFMKLSKENREALVKFVESL
ncbi:MAG: thiol oxidoreductase [Sulfurovum sp.]|nr:thiol oxidoreductase [Sulfurovum sp.]